MIGPDGRRSWLTVVGHDSEAFTDESLKMIKIPRSVSVRFSNRKVPFAAFVGNG